MEDLTLDLEVDSPSKDASHDSMVIGKVILEKPLNRGAVRSIIQNTWPEKTVPVIGEVAFNVYSLAFSNKQDMEIALGENTWSVMGCCFNIKMWPSELSATEVDLSDIAYWVQIHNLPREMFSVGNARKIGSSIGAILEIEEPKGQFGCNRSFLRFRVLVNEKEPLTPDFGSQRMAAGGKSRNSGIQGGAGSGPTAYGPIILNRSANSEPVITEITEEEATDNADVQELPYEFANEDVGLLIPGSLVFNSVVDTQGESNRGESEPERVNNERAMVVGSNSNFSPCRVIRTMMNLSNVFRNLNLKRSAGESAEWNGEMKKSRTEVLLLEDTDRSNPIIPCIPIPKVRRRRGQAVAKKMRKCNKQQMQICEEMSLLEVPITEMAEGPALEVNVLKQMIRNYGPSIIFLSETKNKSKKLESLRCQFGYQKAVYLEPEGIRGGLSLWWKEEDCNFVDLGYKGQQFTWFYRSEGVTSRKGLTGSGSYQLIQKLKRSKYELISWSKKAFPNNRKLIDDLMRELGTLQNLKVEEQDDIAIQCVVQKLEEAWDREEKYWFARSRIKWTIFVEYYKGLFSTEGTRDWGNTLDHIQTLVTDEMNQSLTKRVEVEEVKEAIFQLGTHKAPGQDGFNGLFFQQLWVFVGDTVTRAAMGFFAGGFMLRELNNTCIVLIPKTNSPEEVTQYRSISLYNFTYKVISRILVNRLKN
ncbi:hypothetical protein CCACVL1_04750 [Corchorus capsularis]|uniref:DUF4283 domain-containing protein n=1 Tax=Corchorus capsularis TaxID=210143 RepID=A0A1R3JPV6_COCAP|nr:hypothetical protein CCACVL1_04750 [Corchorus capsularis]